MDTGRLAAFTDGVFAVIITIMVLELKTPHGASLMALTALLPTVCAYVLSFVSVAIYWNNHHHFFQLVDKVNGAILWANVHLLFWVSLVPFATGWFGENPTAALPTAIYGVALLMPALAWFVMQETIIKAQGAGSPLKKAIGADLKGKLSPALYLLGIASAFLDTWIAVGFYLVVALVWLIPDRRVEQTVDRA